MTYRAPVKDMLFCMRELAGLDAVAQLPGFEEAGFDTAPRRIATRRHLTRPPLPKPCRDRHRE